MRLPKGTLYQRGQGQIYWLRYKYKNEPFAESLNTVDPMEAKRRFDDKMTLVKAAVLEGSFAIKFSTAPKSLFDHQGKVPIKSAWKYYLGSPQRPDAKDATLAQYEYQYERFVSWMGVHHQEIQFVAQVTRAIANEYVSDLRSKVRPGTYNKHVNLLRLVFRIMNEDVEGAINPWEKITHLKLDTYSRRAFSMKEIINIFLKAIGELKTLCILGFYTGLRLGDCCCLRWIEVDFDNNVIKRVVRKTGKLVVIPMKSELRAHLSSLQKGGEYVSPKASEDYRRDSAAMTDQFQSLFRKCGIRLYQEGTGVKGKRAKVEVGFHSLRHTFVTMCGENGVSQAAVQAIVGWGNPAMAKTYTHVGQESLRDAIKKLPSMGESAVRNPQNQPNAILPIEKSVSQMDNETLQKLRETIDQEMSRRGESSNADRKVG